MQANDDFKIRHGLFAPFDGAHGESMAASIRHPAESLQVVRVRPDRSRT
jgi:hypothetical protein